jgi:monoamine oxidase
VTGGRACSIRQPFSDNLYAEAGATGIAETNNLTLKYARLFNWILGTRRRRHPIHQRKAGSPHTRHLSRICRLICAPEEKKLGRAGLFKKYTAPVYPEIGDITDSNWPPASLWKYDQMSYTDFLRSRGASAKAIVRMSVFGIWGDGLDTVSALMVLRDDVFFETAKQDFHIRGGNDLLPRCLRGSPSWYKPGQMQEFWPHVAYPEGRVHFAGDHTSPWIRWMQGALFSGIRAAE